MKKSLLIASVVALFVASCAKDRTCSCTYTVVSQTSTEPNYTYTVPAPTTSETKYTKIKSSNVYAQACKTEDVTQTYNSSYYVPGTGGNPATYPASVVTKTTHNDCVLK